MVYKKNICKYDAVQCKSIYFGIFALAVVVVVGFSSLRRIGMWCTSANANATLSIYLSIFLFVFRSSCTLLFSLHRTGVPMHWDTYEWKTYRKWHFFFISNVWTCANSVIHNFMRHSFCYHLLSFLTRSLSLSQLGLGSSLLHFLYVLPQSFHVRFQMWLELKECKNSYRKFKKVKWRNRVKERREERSLIKINASLPFAIRRLF